ncbi:uncharacterized protein MONBRDRAFT_16491, partial [Monosiga brevicollis MX1]
QTIASLLLSFERHPEWVRFGRSPGIWPSCGYLTMQWLNQVNFRQDGHEWLRRSGSTAVREDHYKLRIDGQEQLYGCYSHSAVQPGFRRRCYWLLKHPRIVLVHYLQTGKTPDTVRLKSELYSPASSTRHFSMGLRACPGIVCGEYRGCARWL